ncbi:LysM peptidoglycan-binding domain-containing protein [Micromonospora sp. U21]|uniref:LysM peptidoglycan-binding domain-containing protein n=1 Tax=Micromonospora sp. U21 TaxID=2824899 RepID=UPI001B384DA6|nr:LysM peptidoglycan-binding domain-containing protein [Micromonospora sp. U21]
MSAGQRATYTVRRGDTLSQIAQRCLGDADRWPDIFALNRGTHFPSTGGTLRDLNLIYRGLGPSPSRYPRAAPVGGSRCATGRPRLARRHQSQPRGDSTDAGTGRHDPDSSCLAGHHGIQARHRATSGHRHPGRSARRHRHPWTGHLRSVATRWQLGRYRSRPGHHRRGGPRVGAPATALSSRQSLDAAPPRRPEPDTHVPRGRADPPRPAPRCSRPPRPLRVRRPARRRPQRRGQPRRRTCAYPRGRRQRQSRRRGQR